MEQIIIVSLLLIIFSVQVNFVIPTSDRKWGMRNYLEEINKSLQDLENSTETKWNYMKEKELSRIPRTEEKFIIESENSIGFQYKDCVDRANIAVPDESFRASIRKCYNEILHEFQEKLSMVNRHGEGVLSSIEEIIEELSSTVGRPDLMERRGFGLIDEYQKIVDELEKIDQDLDSKMLDCFDGVQNNFCLMIDNARYQLKKCIYDIRAIVFDNNVIIFQRLWYQC